MTRTSGPIWISPSFDASEVRLKHEAREERGQEPYAFDALEVRLKPETL